MGKILIFGDSIAYGKWDRKGGWATRLRYYIDEKFNIGKENNIQVYNLGIPGEVAPRLSERFEDELKSRIDSEDKNIVLVAIGVNDSCPNNWMTQKQTPEEEFKKSIKNMINIAQKNNCRVVLVGLTPVNPKKSKGLMFTNEEVEKYDNYLTEVAKEKNLSKIDLFENLLSENFGDLLVDSVHPNEKGHKILTDIIIEFLNTKGLIEHCVS